MTLFEAEWRWMTDLKISIQHSYQDQNGISNGAFEKAADISLVNLEQLDLCIFLTMKHIITLRIKESHI